MMSNFIWLIALVLFVVFSVEYFVLAFAWLRFVLFKTQFVRYILPNASYICKVYMTETGLPIINVNGTMYYIHFENKLNGVIKWIWVFKESRK